MPEQCNANIFVGGETLTCELDAGDVTTTHPWGEGEVLHRRNGLYWADDTLGAVPHERFEAVEDSPGGSGWVVLSTRTSHIIARFTSHHSDAEGAAKAEADRLNGTADDHEACRRAIDNANQAANRLLDVVNAAKDVPENCHQYQWAVANRGVLIAVECGECWACRIRAALGALEVE